MEGHLALGRDGALRHVDGGVGAGMLTLLAAALSTGAPCCRSAIRAGTRARDGHQWPATLVSPLFFLQWRPSPASPHHGRTRFSQRPPEISSLRRRLRKIRVSGSRGRSGRVLRTISPCCRRSGRRGYGAAEMRPGGAENQVARGIRPASWIWAPCGAR